MEWDTRLEQVGVEAVAQGVHRHSLGNARLRNGFLVGALQPLFVKIMLSLHADARIDRISRGRKHPELPLGIAELRVLGLAAPESRRASNAVWPSISDSTAITSSHVRTQGIRRRHPGRCRFSSQGNCTARTWR